MSEITDTAREAFESTVNRALPDLRIERVGLVGRGWDSTAFLVNDEIVFRLPNAGSDSQEKTTLHERTRAEVGLLRALRKQLPVAIPDPVYVAPDFSFFGYRYLRGSTLEDREDLVATPDSRSQFINQWLGLVMTLERVVPPHTAQSLGLRPFAHVTDRLGLVHSARASGVMPAAVDDLASQVLEEYGERYQRAASSRSVTMHGDLGLSHWLIDEHDHPYAVIDWSDACLAPVEHELANLYWTNEGATEYVDMAVERYGEQTGAALDRRLIDLGYAANALSDIGLLVRNNPSDPDIAKVIERLEVLVDL
jgi:aminoglycoside phosphotransferase (APT) family kinase protein